MLKAGWTPELRRAYFEWFHRAAGYRGGASFGGFLKNIKSDAVANLSQKEKTSLADVLAERASTDAPAQPPRPFVKNWTMAELVPLIESGLSGRDFDRGRTLFGAASCFSCHRFANEGGAFGPDLTGVSGRFSPRDLLESVVEPSKTISDQYEAVVIATTDGRVITGRIVNLHDNQYSINTDMLNPNAIAGVDRSQIEEMAPSPVSMMPQGLLDTLDKNEVLDLMAYLLSGGDPDNPMFQTSSASARAGASR